MIVLFLVLTFISGMLITDIFNHYYVKTKNKNIKTLNNINCSKNICYLEFNMNVEDSESVGSSMYPIEYYRNKMIITKNVNISDLVIGDIIIFKLGNEDVAHRITDKCDGGFVTKGDNNLFRDGCIPYKNITNKVVAVIW